MSFVLFICSNMYITMAEEILGRNLFFFFLCQLYKSILIYNAYTTTTSSSCHIFMSPVLSLEGQGLQYSWR